VQNRRKTTKNQKKKKCHKKRSEKSQRIANGRSEQKSDEKKRIITNANIPRTLVWWEHRGRGAVGLFPVPLCSHLDILQKGKKKKLKKKKFQKKI